MGEGGVRGNNDEECVAAFQHRSSCKRRKLCNGASSYSSLAKSKIEVLSPCLESKLPSLLPPTWNKTEKSRSPACSQSKTPGSPRWDTLSAIESYRHLPHDLIIANIVASRLPLLDLVRARTVSKSWRDSIFSPTFAENFVVNPDCRRPRLLVEHSSPSGPCLAVFDSHLDCWAVVPTPPFGRLVAASGGLFCFVADAGRPPSLVIGSPLTNQWKSLPPIPLCCPAHGPQLVGMVANSSKGSYNVMVLFGMWNDDATDAYLPFMYNSVSGKWTVRNSISARLSFSTSRSVVKPPDVLKCVDSNAGCLLSYDMTNNVGHTTYLQHLPSLINEEDPKTNLWRRLPQIAVCEGLVYLVARCIGEEAPECKLGQLPIVQHSSVGVWTMCDNSDVWDFVTCIPLDLLETMVKGSDGTDFIIASDGCSKLFFVLKGSPHMLAYDSSLRSWTLLPGCPADYNLYPLRQSAFYEPLIWLAAL
ncbi:hypothetical protein L7F22_029202 [Adiantum nelumboides]|nr:hypothetical protein [Adiantum nelumboides]